MKPTFAVQARGISPAYSETQGDASAPVPSAFWSMAFAFWLATIFILYSRFFDLLLRGFYIPKAVLSCTGIFFLVSGRPFYFVRSTVGKIMLGLLFWISFTMIFSVWKGGSLPFYEQFLQSLFFFAIAAGLPVVVSHVRQSCYTLAFSGVLAALMSFKWSLDVSGRLALDGGSYADPNYFAMGLAAIVPFLWEMATTAESKLIKVFAWLSLGPVFLVLERAGSRAAMLAFAAMLLVWWLISPVQTKIVLIIVSAMGFGVAIATVPPYVRERYLTIFSSDSSPKEESNVAESEDVDRLKADAGSAAERKRLLQESIDLTIEHPIVGVGPGCFQVAVFDEAKAKGIKHNVWMQTHNSYTELSSETGLPGLILLLCLLGASFKNLSVVLKGARPAGEKPDRSAYTAAKSLVLSLVVICVCIFFLAVVYDFTIFVWAGLTVALRRTYEEKRQSGANSEAVTEVEAAPKASLAFASVYAKVQDRLTPRQTPTVSGRPVRFNRFR
jgi:O-antigen ligase